MELGPEATLRTLDARLAANSSDVLARETSAHKVDGLEVGDRSDVVVSGHVGPVSSENASAELIEFHLPARPESGPFQAEVEPPDASKQRPEGEGHGASWHRTSSAFCALIVGPLRAPQTPTTAACRDSGGPSTTTLRRGRGFAVRGFGCATG